MGLDRSFTSTCLFSAKEGADLTNPSISAPLKFLVRSAAQPSCCHVSGKGCCAGSAEAIMPGICCWAAGRRHVCTAAAQQQRTGWSQHVRVHLRGTKGPHPLPGRSWPPSSLCGSAAQPAALQGSTTPANFARCCGTSSCIRLAAASKLQLQHVLCLRHASARLQALTCHRCQGHSETAELMFRPLNTKAGAVQAL